MVGENDPVPIRYGKSENGYGINSPLARGGWFEKISIPSAFGGYLSVHHSAGMV